jgi:hypothetical protein
LEHFVRKFPPQGCRQLGHLAGRSQPIQPGHKRVVQSRGNRQRRQRAGQVVAVLTCLEETRLQHHLGDLFHKQRHAISPGDNLGQHLSGQRLAAREPPDDLFHLALREAGEGELGQVGAASPGRAELRARC